MSELKTCEEYVLRELENTQNELAVFKDESEKVIFELTNKVNKLSRIIEIINPRREFSDAINESYIAVDNICINTNRDKYYELLELLNEDNE